VTYSWGTLLVCSPTKAVYTPKGVLLHAALLGQGCPHCPIFLTAASRRSGARVSVPLWLTTLSGQLPVIDLVSRYLTNYLIGRRSLCQRRNFPGDFLNIPSVCGISPCFHGLSPTVRQVTYVLRTRSPLKAEALRSTCMC
jgi:hypothetical protein